MCQQMHNQASHRDRLDESSRLAEEDCSLPPLANRPHPPLLAGGFGTEVVAVEEEVIGGG